jgi:hypothetical protein
MAGRVKRETESAADRRQWRATVRSRCLQRYRKNGPTDT